MQQQFTKLMLSGWCRQIHAIPALSTQPHPTQSQDDS